MEVVSRSQASVGLHRLAAIAHWAMVASLVLLVCFLLMRISSGNLDGAPTASLVVVIEICVGLTLLGTRISLLLLSNRLSQRVSWIEYAGGLGVHVLAVTTWGLVSSSTLVIALCLVFALLVESASCYLMIASGTAHSRRAPTEEEFQSRRDYADDRDAIRQPPANGEPQIAEGHIQDLASSVAEIESEAEMPSEDDLGVSEPDEWNEDITQQVTRLRNENGSEQVVGLVREEIQTNQRLLISHVVFHPPLKEQVAIKAHVISGASATIRATKNELFGTRFEIKLERVAEEPGSLVYEFIASPLSVEIEDAA